MGRSKAKDCTTDLIRCRDCKFYTNVWKNEMRCVQEKGNAWGQGSALLVKEDDYCSRAERKL